MANMCPIGTRWEGAVICFPQVHGPYRPLLILPRQKTISTSCFLPQPDPRKHSGSRATVEAEAGTPPLRSLGLPPGGSWSNATEPQSLPITGLRGSRIAVGSLVKQRRGGLEICLKKKILEIVCKISFIDRSHE